MLIPFEPDRVVSFGSLPLGGRDRGHWGAEPDRQRERDPVTDEEDGGRDAGRAAVQASGRAQVDVGRGIIGWG